MSERTVTLPSGIVAPKVGFWLHESCPRADEHNPVPQNMNAHGYSPTHRQAKHSVCGLWALWIPKEIKK